MVNVSVIVPNFNYERFLKRRLDSIALQTVKPTEIIFLDDCSTDNSVAVAVQLLETYDIPFKVIPNEANQGVFKQWLKGIGLAHGDYIWIAEADDYCELNLLEKLLPAFDDKEVILSYCQSKLVDSTGHYIEYSKNLATTLDTSRWYQDYTNNCYDEVCNYLLNASSIGNASAVILYKKRLPIPKLMDITNYKMAGDWLFYILMLLENPQLKIAYCSDTLNFWYQHDQSVWGNPYNASMGCKEILNVYIIILQSYRLPKQSKIRILDLLNKNHFTYANAEYVNLIIEVLNLLKPDTDEIQFKELVNYKCSTKSELQRLHQEIERLNQEAGGLHQEIVRLHQEGEKLNQELDNRYNEITRLHHYIAEITNTPSWKITKPLRLIKKILKQMFNFGHRTLP